MCNVTVYKPDKESSRHAAIMYLHGGGLIYGDRNDLPEKYVRMFTEAGYCIYAYDYPLAPQSGLKEILDYLYSAWISFVDQSKEDGYCRHFLFGRSAGAYLALVVTKRLMETEEQNGVKHPDGIIDFYGYYDLNDEALKKPSRYYRSFPPVHDAVLRKLQNRGDGKAVMHEPLDTGYIYYVYARQTGSWMKIVGYSNEPEYGLNNEDIARLPPVFIAASTGDNDVPYSVSKQLSRLSARSKLVTIYYKEHDFDRNIAESDGEKAYKQCLEWLDEICLCNQSN